MGTPPVKSGPETTAKPGIVERTRSFFEEVRTEMNKVNWPSRDELKGLTQVVLVTLVVLGAIIGVYDIIFLQVMGWILELG